MRSYDQILNKQEPYKPLVVGSNPAGVAKSNFSHDIYLELFH
jgi:hypothetical protein